MLPAPVLSDHSSDGPKLSATDSDDRHRKIGEPLLITPPSPSTLEEKYTVSLSSKSPRSPCRTLASTSSSTLEGLPETKFQPLSTLRLLLAHVGAALTLFLATTDATIVSTSLPTITSDLGATHNQYTWVGVAYMLTQTACQPLYGRISDLVGRKNVLWTSMTIFCIGSLLCGTAKTITWLIISRGIAGVGGGGIVSSVWVITSEIVEVRNRAKWSQALSVTWSCSAIAGPLLGGLFSTADNTILSWRWGFYMNLPICLFGFMVLLPSLHNVQLGRSVNASWRDFSQKFDFLGLLLFMSGTSCIVVGFSFATDHGWTAPSTLLLIILGPAVLVCGSVYEFHTVRDALFPPTSFKDTTTVIILVITFLHNFAFNAGTFYLALYFQAVNGSTPLEAGMQLLPYSLGSSLASMPVAWFIGFWQKRIHDTSGQKWVICVGLAVSTLGFGLMNLLHEQSSNLLQALFPLVAGIGLGMLFHAPYQVFIRALKPQEIATGTSAFFLVRFTGATIGLAVAGAVFYGQLSKHLPTEQIQGLGPSIDFSQLESIEPPNLRWEVLRVVSRSIQRVWTICSPCLGIAFGISVLLRVVPIGQRDEPTSSQEKISIKTTNQLSASAETENVVISSPC